MTRNKLASGIDHALPTIKVTGRFRAIVHTGHTFDDEGRVTGYKNILRQTPFGRNVVCNSGFNRMIGATGTLLLGMVAGDGNAAPSVSDLTLASYKGKMSQRTSVVSQIQNDPAEGPLFYRFYYTATFNPGAFGASAVNIAEAGMTFSNTFSNIGPSSPLFSRGLLQDEFGAPTTVSVAPDEYLDLVWEYTEWVPHDVTGTISIDVDGVPTDFDYRVRASHLGGYVSGGAWQPMSSGTASADIINFPNTSNARWWQPTIGSTSWARGTGAGDGTLGVPGSGPTGDWDNNNRPSSMTSSTYVDNSKERSLELTWGPAAANIAGGISTVNIHLGHMMWQVEYDPPIPKVAGKQLTLNYHFSMDNA